MEKSMKEKDKKKHYFLKSLKFLKPYKKYCVICILSCVIATGMSVLFPIYTERLLKAFANEDAKELMLAAGLLVAFQVGHSIVHMLMWGTTASKLRAKVTHDIRLCVVSSIMNLHTKNFDEYGSGKLVQAITSDTDQLSNVYVSIVDVMTTILAKLAIYVYIFVANFWLGLFCIVEFVAVCLVQHVRLSARIKDRRKVKAEIDKNTGIVVETIRGVRDIKNYNIQQSMLETSDKSLGELEKIDTKFGTKQYELFRVAAITKDVFAFLYIPLALVFIHYGITTFSIAFTIFVFRNSAVSVLDWVMNTLEQVKDGGLYAERIFSVLEGFHSGFENFPEKDGFKKLPKNMDICIKDLTFAYGEDGEKVLKDFSINIEFGKKVAFVGESGVGKSTLIKLLNKTYDVPESKIFIGGHDICTFSKSTLRNLVTVVPQDPYIFNFSIYENLKIICPNASQKQIENACKKAQIHDYIMSLPNGYNTMLGEGGTRLSGGQKQRLAIARAFLKNSPILIFDESTSALDNENQNKIKESIDQIGKEKLVIIVAHRLSTIVDVDTIYFVKDGKILTSGTHEELLKNCKGYKKLYKKESQIQE